MGTALDKRLPPLVAASHAATPTADAANVAPVLPFDHPWLEAYREGSINRARIPAPILVMNYKTFEEGAS